ncbi:MAG: MFS transporter [Pseudomonadota bacterium]
MAETTATLDKVYPPAGRAWLMVGVLTVAYVVSFVDRQILNLLIDPIKADLGLTETQIGWLMGPAFGFFYAIMGLPLGYLADRKRRTWIVGVGVALWSAATAFSGMAKSFWQMFMARISVGVGEATLSPCAMSLITDSFPEERRGKPIAFYSSAISLGFGIAGLVSAAVLGWAKTVEGIEVPVLGEVKPWQFAFLVVGLPGLLLAIVFFFMPEPRRILDNPEQKPGNLVDMFAHVGKNWALYVCFVSVFCTMTIIAYSQGWSAVTFSRTHGWDVAQFAALNGVFTLLLGPASVNFAGWLSDRWTTAGMTDAPMRIALLGLILAVPPSIGWSLIPWDWGSFAMYQLTTPGIAFISATGVTALLKIVPGRIRAQTVALYYLLISIIGTLGPLLVGIFNDRLFSAEEVRYSVALIPAIVGIPVLLLAPLTLKLYRRAVEDRLIET